MNFGKILKAIVTVSQLIVTVQAVAKPVADAFKKKPGEPLSHSNIAPRLCDYWNGNWR